MHGLSSTVHMVGQTALPAVGKSLKLQTSTPCEIPPRHLSEQTLSNFSRNVEK